MAISTDHPTDTRILDGALDEVVAHGARRSTVDGMAERAGVGRMTIFRRFGSKDAVLERLAAREIARFLASVDAALADIDDPGERVAEAFVACVRFATEHPLVARLIRHEPGAALEQLRRGDPSPLDLGRMFVAGCIREDQRTGAVKASDADEAADVLVRLALTYVLVPSPVVDVTDTDAARAFALRTLAPIVGV